MKLPHSITLCRQISIFIQEALDFQATVIGFLEDLDWVTLRSRFCPVLVTFGTPICLLYHTIKAEKRYTKKIHKMPYTDLCFIPTLQQEKEEREKCQDFVYFFEIFLLSFNTLKEGRKKEEEGGGRRVCLLGINGVSISHLTLSRVIHINIHT